MKAMPLSRGAPTLLLRLAARALVVWVLEVGALALMAYALPGLRVSGWRAAVWGVAAVGLLNALLRPLLLFFALPLTVLTFGVLSLALNTLTLVVAARVVPGLDVSSWSVALVTTVGLAAINTSFAAVVPLGDEHALYPGLTRRLARRHARPRGAGPGIAILEIDGLSRPLLERAIRDGRMPTLARWVREGTHRVAGWDCGLPSQTSAAQAGILHGDNFDIPAFRWYEKASRRLFVSNHPRDAADIERRVARGPGLLAGGTSLCNMFSGGAVKSVMTTSTLPDARGEVRRYTAPYYWYFLSPYHFTRTFVLMLWDVLSERAGAVYQHLAGVRPRVARGATHPLLRAVSAVLLRDISVHMLVEDMFAGVRVSYTSFVGYDVVAHYAGVDRGEALRVLRGIDAQIGRLERAAAAAPRPYRFVVLSDHGQSSGTTFRQRYGQTLEELVRTLLRGEHTLHSSVGSDESRAHLDALLAEVRLGGRLAALTPLMAADAIRRDDGESGPRAGAADVVVCNSGNLGLVYFTDLPARATLETIDHRYPGVVKGLASHEGVGFVLVRSARHGALALGREGAHYLDSGRVEGHDPLAPFGAHAADHLRRLDSFPNVADLVVNSCVDPATGEVAAFEEQVGSHGGLGGAQTDAFLMYPAEWELGAAAIRGAPAVYRVLRRWLDEYASG